MNSKTRISRRVALRNVGVAGGALLALGSGNSNAGAAEPSTRAPKPLKSANAREEIFERVLKTALVDTHEHLPDESQRLQPTAPEVPVAMIGRCS